MSGNMTYQHKLVEQLPLSRFLSGGKPAGREGFEVIVMKQVGTGSHYYCTLAAGDTLQMSEQVFGSFYAYIVDTRMARVLDISEQLPTANPLIKVKVTAKVLYRVINARRVALEVDDPLDKFRDRILGILRRDLSRLPYQKVSEANCEDTIRSIGAVQSLGIAVEGVDLIIVEHDSQVLRGLQQRAELEYNRGLGQELGDEAHLQALRHQQNQQELERRELEAKLEFDRLQREHDMSMQRSAIDEFNLRDLNTLIHLHPELTQEIISRLSDQEQKLLENRLTHDSAFQIQMFQVINQYVQNNKDAPPEEVLRLIREAAAQSSTIGINARISFGAPAAPSTPKQITFGRVIEGQVVPPRPSPPQDDDE